MSEQNNEPKQENIASAEQPVETTAAVSAVADPATFPVKAILGQKVGMTQIFDEEGKRIPVSVISTTSCALTQIKTNETDGYSAIQLGVGECKEKNLPKAYIQHFKKNNAPVVRWLKEFRVANSETVQVGQKVPAAVFVKGDYVDISGTSKGKGFAGVMKRHNFRGLTASHGASDKVRARGSSGGGSGQPQRVFKGTGMAGRMGGEWITTLKLEIVNVDSANDLILVKGAVPGTVGSFVAIQQTSRARKVKRAVIGQKVSAKKAAVAAKKPAPKK